MNYYDLKEKVNDEPKYIKNSPRATMKQRK